MSLGIPLNIATEAMEEINEQLCWLYTTDLTELSKESFHIQSNLLISLIMSRALCFRISE
jgi:hypothetical protein